MITYGGSVAEKLGQLYRLGSENNRLKIKATWPDYWQKYTELAELAELQAKQGQTHA
jgi:hypothetical protein